MTTIKEMNDNIESVKRSLSKFGKLMIEKNKIKMEKNRMKTMTKEQAEKAAKEFAWKKIEEGLYVQKIIHGSIISVYYTKGLMQFDGKSFPFVDLVPGDACLVRGIDQKWVIKMFSRLRESGRPLFVSKIENIGNMTWGVTYDNYRKLGFNVLEIEEGWGDGE